MQDIFGTRGLLIAYTQVSYWQIYNNSLSRPLEINYEPEIILNFPVKCKVRI
jgi:phospholipase A1